MFGPRKEGVVSKSYLRFDITPHGLTSQHKSALGSGDLCIHDVRVDCGQQSMVSDASSGSFFDEPTFRSAYVFLQRLFSFFLSFSQDACARAKRTPELACW